MIKYNLLRNEVQDLFIIGKSQKTNLEVNQDVLHKRLFQLTHPQPYLQPRQVKWWLDLCMYTDTKAPMWLIEASLTEIN